MENVNLSFTVPMTGAALRALGTELISLGQKLGEPTVDQVSGAEIPAEAPKKARAAKKAAPVEETVEETTEDWESESVEETEEAPKYEKSDVIAALQAYAKRHKSKEKALMVLQKKFKVKGVGDLKAEQYGEVIEALG